MKEEYMKQIVILVLAVCCILGCSSQRAVETLPQPKAADVTHVSAQQFTSILMDAPSLPHSKQFLGYENGLAYLEVVMDRNGIKEKEIYCTPQKGLPKHTVDSLKLMENR